ncbi:MAG: hypothetical protein QOF61_589 [Acidobacteriota bacterium]|jgi:glycosyltransferase involved in cell wall biosynthesis|nr:hypothetical protein [Acidobacteriota bacterium]
MANTRASRKLRVAINAQIKFGNGAGGIETVLRVLTHLGALDDGAEEYVFISPWDGHDWLQPLLNSRLCVVSRPAPAPAVERRLDPVESLKRSLGPLRPALRGIRRLLNGEPRTVYDVPASDGFYEKLGCDVIHFPFQNFVRCALPSIYNPHDLQHRHFPQFFSREEILHRETIYQAGCRAAHTVVVASQFVKQDIVRSYRIPEEKVQVIPWAPPPLESTPVEPGVASRAVAEGFDLFGEPFALYPAMTWEHKNHIRLLEAVALLRDRGSIKLRLVCTGHLNDFWLRIERRMSELGLWDQVKFLGVVSRGELGALYRAAQFVIVPTLFEAVSAPLFEAWQHDTPVACSAVTSLPEQARGAALLFDPQRVEAIAEAVSRIATDGLMREELRRRGQRRLQDFSLERTAKAYRAAYRRAAGRVLTEEEHWLLSTDWTSETAASGAFCQRSSGM